MSESHIEFESECPNGHVPKHKFEPSRLRELLQAGRLSFICPTCTDSWPATPGEAERARQLLEEMER